MTDETGARGPSTPGEVVVADLETLRVLSDPLRMRMVDLMSRGEWTVKQVAEALGVGQTRLYHHISLLEKHELVRVTGTRMVSGILEKRYASPSRLTIDHRLFGGGGDAPAEVGRAVDRLVGTVFATVRREIERSIEGGKIELDTNEKSTRGVTLTFDGARLTESTALQFRNRLEALVREFSDLDEGYGPGRSAESAGAGGEPPATAVATNEYRLLVGFFRAAHAPDPGSGAGE